MSYTLPDEEMTELVWSAFELHCANVHGGEVSVDTCHACAQFYAAAAEIEFAHYMRQDIPDVGDGHSS